MTVHQGCQNDALACHTVRGAARLGTARGDAVLVIDLEEHRRRGDAGMGPVLQLHLLDTLSHLPDERPVVEHRLAEHDRRRALAAPTCLVERTAAGLLRRFRPAVEVLSIQIPSGPWAAKIRQAADLARLAPTTIMLSRLPSPEQMLQADFFGIGLAGAGPLTGDEYRPAVVPRASSSAVAWLFRERAYAVWLS